MAKRTPVIRTGDGRQITVARIHPARYSDEHVDLFSRLAQREAAALGRPIRVLDPMGGVGNIHRIAASNVETVANEIERPFVDVAHQLWPDRLTVQGDAGALGFADGAFDAVMVSPDFGNRLADHHKAKDPCACRKVRDEHGKVVEVRPEPVPGCSTCDGTGRSLRRSYLEDLRRLTGDGDYELTAGSSAGSYAWQDAYWKHQRRYWSEAWRVLRPGGLIAIDVKDAVRTVKGERRTVLVVHGHREILTGLGFEIEGDVPLDCDGLRFGANHELRVDGHVIIVGRRPAVSAEVAA